MDGTLDFESQMMEVVKGIADPKAKNLDPKMITDKDESWNELKKYYPPGTERGRKLRNVVANELRKKMAVDAAKANGGLPKAK